MEAQEDVQQPRPETQEGPEAVELHVLQETPAPGETPVGDADEPSEERAAGVGTVPEGVEEVTLEELQPGTLQDAIMGTHQALARLDGDTGTVSQADMQAAFGASGVAEIQAMMPILAQGMPSISQNQEVYEQLLMAAQLISKLQSQNWNGGVPTRSSRRAGSLAWSMWTRRHRWRSTRCSKASRRRSRC